MKSKEEFWSSTRPGSLQALMNYKLLIRVFSRQCSENSELTSISPVEMNETFAGREIYGSEPTSFWSPHCQGEKKQQFPLRFLFKITTNKPLRSNQPVRYTYRITSPQYVGGCRHDSIKTMSAFSFDGHFTYIAGGNCLWHESLFIIFARALLLFICVMWSVDLLWLFEFAFCGHWRSLRNSRQFPK